MRPPRLEKILANKNRKPIKNIPPEDFINWVAISTFLTGGKTSIRKKRISNVHEDKINELVNFIYEWQKKYQK